jgi:hypothetical protein
MASEFRGTEVFGRPRRASPARPPSRDDRQRPGTALGVIAVVAGVATIVLVCVGISSAMSGKYAVGIALAYVATGTSIVAVLGGISAMVLDRGRGWGAVAIVVGLAANPLLLTRVLAWAGGLG